MTEQTKVKYDELSLGDRVISYVNESGNLMYFGGDTLVQEIHWDSLLGRRSVGLIQSITYPFEVSPGIYSEYFRTTVSIYLNKEHVNYQFWVVRQDMASQVTAVPADATKLQKLINDYTARQRLADSNIEKNQDMVREHDVTYKELASVAWSNRLKELQKEAREREKRQVMVDLDFDD